MTESAKAESLRRDRAMAALCRLELAFAEGSEEFPSIADEIVRTIFDERKLVTRKYHKNGKLAEESERFVVDAKVKSGLMQSVARLIGAVPLALADRGLSKNGPKKIENHAHLHLALSPEDFARLPEETQRRLMREQLAAARGQLPEVARG